MAKTREQKESVVKKVQEALKGAQSVVFVNFHGLPVAQSGAMRRELRKEGVGFFVAKKTLIRRALEGEKFEGQLPELPGEIALAYGADALMPARSIAAFVKKYKESLAIVGGIFEGAFQGKESMVAIANIPPLEILRAQFVQIINSPLQRFATVISEGAKKK